MSRTNQTESFPLPYNRNTLSSYPERKLEIPWHCAAVVTHHSFGIAELSSKRQTALFYYWRAESTNLEDNYTVSVIKSNSDCNGSTESSNTQLSMLEITAEIPNIVQNRWICISVELSRNSLQLSCS